MKNKNRGRFKDWFFEFLVVTVVALIVTGLFMDIVFAFIIEALRANEIDSWFRLQKRYDFFAAVVFISVMTLYCKKLRTYGEKAMSETPPSSSDEFHSQSKRKWPISAYSGVWLGVFFAVGLVDGAASVFLQIDHDLGIPFALVSATVATVIWVKKNQN